MLGNGIINKYCGFLSMHEKIKSSGLPKAVLSSASPVGIEMFNCCRNVCVFFFTYIKYNTCIVPLEVLQYRSVHYSVASTFLNIIFLLISLRRALEKPVWAVCMCGFVQEGSFILIDL